MGIVLESYSAAGEDSTAHRLFTAPILVVLNQASSTLVMGVRRLSADGPQQPFDLGTLLSVLREAPQQFLRLSRRVRAPIHSGVGDRKGEPRLVQVGVDLQGLLQMWDASRRVAGI